MTKARTTKAEITRVVQAWLACGLTVGGIEVDPDGTIRVLSPLDRATQKTQSAPRRFGDPKDS